MLIWLGKQYLGQAEKIEENGDYKITVERVNVAKIEKVLTLGERQN